MHLNRMLDLKKFCLLLMCGFAINVYCQNSIHCTKDTGLLRRIGKTRFFIVQNLKKRGNFVDAFNAPAVCKSYDENMEVATVNSMLTLAVIGRELETLVTKHVIRDSWYWLSPTYDSKHGYYVYTNHTTKTTEQLTFSAFLYRKPRPVGIGAHITYKGDYDPNIFLKQCLALSLPWPGMKDQIRRKKFYGHQTIIEERACESRQARHVLCENPLCNEKDNTDPYVLGEGSRTRSYFEDGNWIFGDRKYIVNWGHRTKKEAESYCKALGLKVFEPGVHEKFLIPHLKMWSRSITVVQFWTNFKYNSKSAHYVTGDGRKVVPLDPVRFTEISRKSKLPRRSYKSGQEFCVGMSYSYELQEQQPCISEGNRHCNWSFAEYFPANCNNHFATICQHEDMESRSISWKPGYLQNVENAIQDSSLQGFGYRGNKQTLRSTVKQVFGAVYCPPGYRMLRIKEKRYDYILPWNETPSWIMPNKTFKYDLTEEFWVIDDDHFDKKADSKCSYTIPGKGPTFSKQASCSDWRFYLCEKVLHFRGHKMHRSVKAPAMNWNAEPQRRLYPIYEKAK